MKKNPFRSFGCVLLLVLLALCLPGCAVAGGIFKAGIWVGVLAVVLVVGLILYFVSKGRK